MRRKALYVHDDSSSENQKEQNQDWLSVMSSIQMNWKRIFMALILLSIAIYFIPYLRIFKTNLSINVEVGDQMTKSRRRPDLNDDEIERNEVEKYEKDMREDIAKDIEFKRASEDIAKDIEFKRASEDIAKDIEFKRASEDIAKDIDFKRASEDITKHIDLDLRQSEDIANDINFKQSSENIPKDLDFKQSPEATKADEERLPKRDNTIHVAIVACGDRAPEAIISLKSFAVFSKTKLQYHIFAEENLHAEFATSLSKWPRVINENIKFNLYPIQFPEKHNNNFEEWKKLFKPCASQRLFLPDILKHVDSLLYVDTDVLMLRPAEDIWSFFTRFNDSHLAALTPEHEIASIGWYSRFARHPYYGKAGVNSGVMLMNLTRMRHFGWEKVYRLKDEYRLQIVWGDQDILNIIFNFHPELLYVFPCSWNYRPDHCMYGNNCEDAKEHGISVVHGNRGVFHNEKQPEFKVLYDAFRDYSFGADIKTTLFDRIEHEFHKFQNTYCGQTGSAVLKILHGIQNS